MDLTSPKCINLASRRVQAPQSLRVQSEGKVQMKENELEKRLQQPVAVEAKHRLPISQGLPLTTDKPLKVLQKPTTKEQTKPLEIRLHTQTRAIRRAGFNDLVAQKINWLEQQRERAEKLQKMIEDEEIRLLRKEMIPRAQLMPLFDRPFFPQRSTRPLTVPREPCFHLLRNKCWKCICCSEVYSFQQRLNQNMKPIK